MPIQVIMSDSNANSTQTSKTPVHLEEDGIFVALTHETLDAVAIMNKVRSPKAGAIVLFAGTP
jgi:molybdopterin synthase catalytic subunit